MVFDSIFLPLMVHALSSKVNGVIREYPILALRITASNGLVHFALGILDVDGIISAKKKVQE